MTRQVLAAIALGVLALVGTPALSLACVLNNQASLSADGHAAVRDLGAGTTLFRFERVYGRGGSIRFA